MKKSIYRFIFCQLMGWKIIGTVDPKIKKCILMVLPHTSWHDFYLGIFTRGVLGIEMHFVGKKELFRFPFGWFFRWMGGTALDRSGGLNKVDAMATIFKQKEVFRMGISPEGTRKKVAELKTGFYYIALKAEVPIIPVAFNFEKREVGFGNPYHPTGDYEKDLKNILTHFQGVKGKNPENGYLI
jgi:1-acyl-sn-glycerol-3-phosphate acyltransferase